MDNKRYKTSIGIITGLGVLSVGLFGYQNFYYGKQQANLKETIYVAKSDIQAKTKITPDMFQAVQIPKGSNLKTYVTDIKPYEGKELKGGVLAGEPLTSVRINTEGSDLKANLDLELQADYLGDVRANDNVKVYVMLTDRQSGQVQIKELFGNKKITVPGQAQSSGGSSLVNVSGSGDNEKQKLLIKVTDTELQDYYKAKATGKIIISKITDIDPQKIVSDGTTKQESSDGKTTGQFDPNSKETQNSYRPTDNSDNSIAVMSYTVKDEDTIDSICQKFKTTKDVVSKLNKDTVDFKAGDKITVPAI